MFMGLVAAAIMATDKDLDRENLPVPLRRWAVDDAGHPSTSS
jgi:hypothetical protein